VNRTDIDHARLLSVVLAFKQVVIRATKDAVRLGLPGKAEGVACKGCPPI
jgi:hypothetical protein